jgi:hypothetical protein
MSCRSQGRNENPCALCPLPYFLDRPFHPQVGGKVRRDMMNTQRIFSHLGGLRLSSVIGNRQNNRIMGFSALAVYSCIT